MGNIARPEENDVYQIEASYGQSAALKDELTRTTIQVGKGSVIGRTALNRADSAYSRCAERSEL